MISPKRLKKGDTIGMVSISSPITTERVQACIKKLEEIGFKVKAGRNLDDFHGGFMAGTAKERAEILAEMFRDPEVDAVFCARGGDSGSQCLPLIDFNAIRENPKIFMGYSDVTCLSTVIVQKLGIVCFHGPMVSSNMVDHFDPETEASMFEVLSGDRPCRFWNPEGKELQVMHPGSAEGQLVGGNLCLISAGLGTEYELDTEGKILFLEDVHGDVGETERNISHLILAGTIQKAKGLLLGQFTDISNVNDPSYTTIDCFRELLADIPIPIMYGLESGHDFPMMTLPLGADCRMDTETREIVFNW